MQTCSGLTIAELRLWLILAAAGLDGSKLQRLRQHLTVEQLLALPSSTLQQLGLTVRQASIIRHGAADRVELALDWLQQSDQHHIIPFENALYPPLLRQIKYPPLLLFVKGQTAILSQPQVAIVGSRQPTPTGKKVAADFAGGLCQQGFVVTSGMARGIDSCAHYGALAASGLTIAVLGHGLQQVYPLTNRQLADQISSNGALVSEYFPDVTARAEFFPQRNRIVVGLSKGTLVVEAALKSGSLISANLAADNNREVFAIPGSVYSVQSAGCHQLIQQGAKLVTCVADILEEWQFFSSNSRNNMPESQKNEPADLSDKALLANVGDEVIAIDRIAELTEMSVEDVTIALLQLELTGQVAVVPGGYIRVRSS